MSTDPNKNYDFLYDTMNGNVYYLIIVFFLCIIGMIKFNGTNHAKSTEIIGPL